jgi:hypothetical protein
LILGARQRNIHLVLLWFGSWKNSMSCYAPEWVKKTPNDPAWYHGIGTASKTSQMDFRERAKQNALSDMAGNISVNISSSSVLTQYEVDKKFSEYFRDNIKLSTKNYLEGYEMVESWESIDRYWVYYRLSKAEYERIKKERIQTALSKSTGDYRELEKSIQAGKSAEAISSAIKAIEKIKDFLGEDLQTEVSGQSQSYTSRLFADLTSTLQNIRIVYPQNPIQATRGQKSQNEIVNASAENENQVRLTNIPVITTYSWFPGKKDELVSDASGTIRIKPGIINSKKKTEYISTFVNFDKMVRETTADPVVRKLLANFKLTEYVLPVELVPSVFYVAVPEKSPDQKSNDSRLQKEITALLINDGFGIAPEPGQSGFVITIESITSKGSERNGKFMAALTADFLVQDKAGNKVYQQQISEITGLGPSFENAASDACNALISKIRISVFPAMYKQIFKE